MKFKVYVSTDKVGSECETEHDVDTEEWESMTAEEQEHYMRDIMFEMIEWNWEEVK